MVASFQCVQGKVNDSVSYFLDFSMTPLAWFILALRNIMRMTSRFAVGLHGKG